MDKGISEQLQVEVALPDHGPARRVWHEAKGRIERGADWVAAKLTRVTTSGELLPEVDGLRFVAIAAVVFHHLVSIYLPRSGQVARIETREDWLAAAPLSPWVDVAYCGYFGVHLFFVLSGFILALPFIRRASSGAPPPSWQSYYRRRLIRIEPPYLICLLVYLTAKMLRLDSVTGLIPHFLASAVYLHGPLFGQESLINGVAWSLEVEIQFYLLVPLLMAGLRMRNPWWRRGGLLLAIIFFGLLSQEVIYPSAPRAIQLSLLNYAHYFLAGILLAELSMTRAASRRGTLLVGDLLVLLSGAALFAIIPNPGDLLFLLPFLVMLLYAGVHLGRLANRIIRWRWFVIIGGMCYTIYLYHTMIISLVFVRSVAKRGAILASPQAVGSFEWELLRQAMLVIPTLLLLSALLYLAIEKPFMRWSGSRGKRLPQGSTL